MTTKWNQWWDWYTQFSRVYRKIVNGYVSFIYWKPPLVLRTSYTSLHQLGPFLLLVQYAFLCSFCRLTSKLLEVHSNKQHTVRYAFCAYWSNLVTNRHYATFLTNFNQVKWWVGNRRKVPKQREQVWSYQLLRPSVFVPKNSPFEVYYAVRFFEWSRYGFWRAE